MTVADHVLSAAGIRSWRQEDVFSKQTVRRMIIAMTTNQAYLGSNRTNPLHYQKFGLSQIVIYRYGIPIVGTPIVTTHDKRVYFITLDDLDFLDKEGHGRTLTDYPNHFTVAFDLTSTQEASHDFIHPELTNCSISVDLTFSRALPNKKEILFLGERSSTLYVSSDRKVTKILQSHIQQMDNTMILELIERCKHLKFKFTGVFAADNFAKLVDETFMIVNASEAVMAGCHRLLLCKKQQETYFADPLGLPIQSYIVFYKRLTRFYNEDIQLFKLKPIQN